MTEREPKEQLQRAAFGVRRYCDVGFLMAPEPVVRAYVRATRNAALFAKKLFGFKWRVSAI